MIADPVIAQLLGLVSFALGVSTFYQKDDKRLKITMFIFNLNHLVHYLLLGAVPAALSSLLSSLRTGTSIYTSSKLVAFVFIAISVTAGWFVVEQWYGWFPIAGTVIGTYSLFCLSGIQMRLAFLVGASCWLTNNIIVGSIGGTLLEATVIGTNILTIYRLNRQQMKTVTNSG